MVGQKYMDRVFKKDVTITTEMRMDRTFQKFRIG